MPHVSVALTGESQDRPGDPFLIAIPMAVDRRVLDGATAIAKDRLEDIQMLSCTTSLSVVGWLRHPLSVSLGYDPPDRILTVDGIDWAVELTELTFEQLRSDLSRARLVGRMIQAIVDADLATYPHLVGRVVIVAWLPNPELYGSTAPTPPRDPQAIARIIADVLKTDIGYAGEGVDYSAGFPQQMPPNGFHGDVLAGYNVHVRPGADGQPPLVSCTASGQAHLSEIRSVLFARIAAKDDSRNQILIVSTGLIDKAGYICPLDSWLFSSLLEHGAGEIPEPAHLDAILLHEFSTGQVARLYQREGAVLPWVT